MIKADAPKTFEFVTYAPAAEGEPITGAITEYDRADGGQLIYVGREWLDEQDTAIVYGVLASIRERRLLAQAAADLLKSE